MHLDSVPDYTEELPMHNMARDQYFSAALQAIQQLRWSVATISETEITCHTRGINNTLGEIVTITLADNDNIIFNSRPANEYYWKDQQGLINVARYKEALQKVTEHYHLEQKKVHPLTREKYGAFVPSKTYMVTPILLYLNVAVFLLMVIAGISPVSPQGQSLFAWGANYRLAVLQGDWWRLFTYMFLHAGIAHLAMNMFALVYIGLVLEPLLGRLRFAAAYILTGVGAGIMSITHHADAVGVGASGAIFGMYGVFLAMLTTRYMPSALRKTMLRSILFFVVFNLIMGMQGNVDNAAHIGGLCSGILIGYAYYPGIKQKHGTKGQLTAISLAALLIGMFAILMIKRMV